MYRQMSKFSKRLRYSVGGTYRWYGPGKSLSVDKGSSRFFFIFTERLTKYNPQNEMFAERKTK